MAPCRFQFSKQRGSQYAGPHHLRRIGALVDAEAEQCREEGRRDVDAQDCASPQPLTSGVDGFLEDWEGANHRLGPVMGI